MLNVNIHIIDSHHQLVIIYTHIFQKKKKKKREVHKYQWEEPLILIIRLTVTFTLFEGT